MPRAIELASLPCSASLLLLLPALVAIVIAVSFAKGYLALLLSNCTFRFAQLESDKHALLNGFPDVSLELRFTVHVILRRVRPL